MPDTMALTVAERKVIAEWLDRPGLGNGLKTIARIAGVSDRTVERLREKRRRTAEKQQAES